MADAIPPNIKRALDAWAEHGQWPGDFVRAVLENNLRETFGRADAFSAAAMPAIVSYVWCRLPGDCHGSRDMMEAYAEKIAKRAARVP